MKVKITRAEWQAMLFLIKSRKGEICGKHTAFVHAEVVRSHEMLATADIEIESEREVQS